MSKLCRARGGGRDMEPETTLRWPLCSWCNIPDEKASALWQGLFCRHGAPPAARTAEWSGLPLHNGRSCVILHLTNQKRRR